VVNFNYQFSTSCWVNPFKINSAAAAGDFFSVELVVKFTINPVSKILSVYKTLNGGTYTAVALGVMTESKWHNV